MITYIKHNGEQSRYYISMKTQLYAFKTVIEIIIAES